MTSTRPLLIRRRRDRRDRRQRGLLQGSYLGIVGRSAGRVVAAGTELPVEQRPEVCSGALVFRGTRIPVEQIVALLRRGIPDSEIREDYPTLSDDALVYARKLAHHSHWRLSRPGPLKLRRR